MFRKLIKSRKLRTRTSWILAIVLIPPFIFFFHLFSSPSSDSGPAGAAGMIFGKPVPWDLYQQQYTQMRRQLENRLAGSDGQPVDLPAAFEPLIVQTTWDRLILLEEAKKRRLRVSDEQLADFIRSEALFQVDGRFLPERYRQYVAAIGMAPRAFEAFLRNQLLVQQLTNDVRRAVPLSDEAVREAFLRANERLKAAIIVITPTAFHDEARNAITEEALRVDYDARPELVEIPAQITFEYVGLTRDRLAETLTVPEEDIATSYEVYLDEVTADDETIRPLEEVREEILATLLPRHIRRRLNGLALDLEDALDAGQSFEGLATALELTTHTVGPIEVGNLWVEGVPEPALLQTAFALEEGAMSEVVETDNGVYVLRISRHMPSQVPPFEEVRDTIRKRLVQERAWEAARTSAEGLRAQLTQQRAMGVTIEEAARQLGIPLTQPEPFSRTDAVEPIGQVPAINQAAFDTPIGELTDVIETPQGFVLLAPQELLAANEMELPDQQDRLREQLLAEKQDTRFAQWMADLRIRANLQSFVEQSPVAPQP